MGLRFIRKRHNYTQAQLATVLECDRSTISKIENGIVALSVKDAKKLAKELNVNWTIFFAPSCEENEHKTAN